jgi:hypothetical protein
MASSTRPETDPRIPEEAAPRIPSPLRRRAEVVLAHLPALLALAVQVALLVFIAQQWRFLIEAEKRWQTSSEVKDAVVALKQASADFQGHAQKVEAQSNASDEVKGLAQQVNDRLQKFTEVDWAKLAQITSRFGELMKDDQQRPPRSDPGSGVESQNVAVIVSANLPRRPDGYQTALKDALQNEPNAGASASDRPGLFAAESGRLRPLANFNEFSQTIGAADLKPKSADAGQVQSIAPAAWAEVTHSTMPGGRRYILIVGPADRPPDGSSGDVLKFVDVIRLPKDLGEATNSEWATYCAHRHGVFVPIPGLEQADLEVLKASLHRLVWPASGALRASPEGGAPTPSSVGATEVGPMKPPTSKTEAQKSQGR